MLCGGTPDPDLQECLTAASDECWGTEHCFVASVELRCIEEGQSAEMCKMN